MINTTNTAFVLSECEKKDLEKRDRLQQNFIASEDSELVTNSNVYIGCGINVINSSGPTTANVIGSLLNSAEPAGNYLEVLTVQEGSASSVESDSFLEVFTSLKIEAEVRTGKAVPFFSGGLSAKYGESRKVTTTAKFYSSMVEISTEKHIFKPGYRNVDRLKTLLDPLVLQDINDKNVSPARIFSMYGTHMIKAVSIGGSIQITAVSNSSQELKSHEFKAAMDAACAYVSAKSSAELTSEQEAILSNSDIYAYSFGGKPNVLAGRLSNVAQMTSLLDLWGQSMEDTKNHVLSKIHQYEPLWKFADTKERQQELEDGFYDFAAQQGIDVSTYITKDMPAKLVGLLGHYKRSNGQNVACYTCCAPSRITTRPSEFETERLKNLASIAGYVATDPMSKLRMIENSDKTVSFQLCSSGMYLRVHTHSSDSTNNYMNRDQLYFSGTNINEREKFNLEETAKGSKRFKLKAKFNGSYIYTCQNFASVPTICANQSKGDQLLEFELTYI